MSTMFSSIGPTSLGALKYGAHVKFTGNDNITHKGLKGIRVQK